MYLSSGVIVTLAGFITFPIWTRVFTEAEYGEMSLATATLGIIIVFSKFGLQRAALRFYSEFKENKYNLDITYYYTTAFLSILIISFTMAAIFGLVVEFYPGKLDAQYTEILRILSLLIISDALNDIFLMFLRAEQNVKLHSIIKIIGRYSRVCVTVLFVLVLKLGLLGFFVGWALVDALIAAILFMIFLKQGKIKFRNISISLFKESLSYGLPLIGFELSALLLNTGDRFLLQYFLGSAAVGIYSAAHNLTKYFVDFFSNPFRLAVMPFFMSIWEKKGKEETQHFLSSVIKLYFMIGVPIIFAVSFIGRDIIVLLASKKFEEGYIIMPFVITGFVIYKANFIYGAGLYLKKKTIILLIINFIAAVINIILNIIMIPGMKLYGAAISTLIAHLIEVVLVVSVSFRTVSFKFPLSTILKYVAISIIMVFVMLNIHTPGSAQTFVRVIAGFLTYGTGILLLETEVRTKAGILLHKIFAR